MNEILNRIAKAQTEHQLNASQADFLAELAARVEVLEKLRQEESAPRCLICGGLMAIPVPHGEIVCSTCCKSSTADLAAPPPLPAASGGPQREQYPIPLNEAQEATIKQWASDDRLWTTRETVEFNLTTFARCILRDDKPPPREADAGQEERETVRQKINAYLENCRTNICQAIDMSPRGSDLRRTLMQALTELDAFRHGTLQNCDVCGYYPSDPCAEQPPPPAPAATERCSMCGKVASVEPDWNRGHGYLCSECHSRWPDPLVEKLIASEKERQESVHEFTSRVKSERQEQDNDLEHLIRDGKNALAAYRYKEAYGYLQRAIPFLEQLAAGRESAQPQWREARELHPMKPGRYPVLKETIPRSKELIVDAVEFGPHGWASTNPVRYWLPLPPIPKGEA